jgi:hypothetical protein
VVHRVVVVVLRTLGTNHAIKPRGYVALPLLVGVLIDQRSAAFSED